MRMLFACGRLLERCVRGCTHKNTRKPTHTHPHKFSAMHWSVAECVVLIIWFAALPADTNKKSSTPSSSSSSSMCRSDLLAVNAAESTAAAAALSPSLCRVACAPASALQWVAVAVWMGRLCGGRWFRSAGRHLLRVNRIIPPAWQRMLVSNFVCDASFEMRRDVRLPPPR